jgi:hypothetical protein
VNKKTKYESIRRRLAKNISREKGGHAKKDSPVPGKAAELLHGTSCQAWIFKQYSSDSPEYRRWHIPHGGRDGDGGC